MVVVRLFVVRFHRCSFRGASVLRRGEGGLVWICYMGLILSTGHSFFELEAENTVL